MLPKNYTKPTKYKKGGARKKKKRSGKPVPTNPSLWSRAKSMARSKFDVYPSAYANAWASKWYKSKGGGWRGGKKKAAGGPVDLSGESVVLPPEVTIGPGDPITASKAANVVTFSDPSKFKPRTGSSKDFLEDAYSAANYVVNETGTSIDPRVIALMSAVESGYGKSGLTTSQNNYFGIKDTKNSPDKYKSKKQWFTKEVVDGTDVKVQSKFESHPSFIGSMMAFVEFLERNPRYSKAGVFSANNPEAQFDALKEAGYRTGDFNSEKKMLSSYADMFNSPPVSSSELGAQTIPSGQLEIPTQPSNMYKGVKLPTTRDNIIDKRNFGGYVGTPEQSIEQAIMQNQMLAMGVDPENPYTRMYMNGGKLYSTGGQQDKLTRIDAGGTHEQNPLEGVPMGPDALVEQGETVQRGVEPGTDFVFSERLPEGGITPEMAQDIGLPKFTVGKSFAEASKKIEDKSSRSGDLLDRNTKEVTLARLRAAQEEFKDREFQSQLAEIEDMYGRSAQPNAPEPTQMAPQPSPQEMAMMQAGMAGQPQQPQQPGQGMQMPGMVPRSQEEVMIQQMQMPHGGPHNPPDLTPEQLQAIALAMGMDPSRFQSGIPYAASNTAMAPTGIPGAPVNFDPMPFEDQNIFEPVGGTRPYIAPEPEEYPISVTPPYDLENYLRSSGIDRKFSSSVPINLDSTSPEELRREQEIDEYMSLREGLGGNAGIMDAMVRSTGVTPTGDIDSPLARQNAVTGMNIDPIQRDVPVTSSTIPGMPGTGLNLDASPSMEAQIGPDGRMYYPSGDIIDQDASRTYNTPPFNYEPEPFDPTQYYNNMGPASSFEPDYNIDVTEEDIPIDTKEENLGIPSGAFRELMKDKDLSLENFSNPYRGQILADSGMKFLQGIKDIRERNAADYMLHSDYDPYFFPIEEQRKALSNTSASVRKTLSRRVSNPGLYLALAGGVTANEAAETAKLFEKKFQVEAADNARIRELVRADKAANSQMKRLVDELNERDRQGKEQLMLEAANSFSNAYSGFAKEEFYAFLAKEYQLAGGLLNDGKIEVAEEPAKDIEEAGPKTNEEQNGE